MTSPRFPDSRRVLPVYALWFGFIGGMVFAAFILAVA